MLDEPRHTQKCICRNALSTLAAIVLKICKDCKYMLVMHFHIFVFVSENIYDSSEIQLKLNLQGKNERQHKGRCTSVCLYGYKILYKDYGLNLKSPFLMPCLLGAVFNPAAVIFRSMLEDLVDFFCISVKTTLCLLRQKQHFKQLLTMSMQTSCHARCPGRHDISEITQAWNCRIVKFKHFICSHCRLHEPQGPKNFLLN